MVENQNVELTLWTLQSPTKSVTVFGYGPTGKVAELGKEPNVTYVDVEEFPVFKVESFSDVENGTLDAAARDSKEKILELTIEEGLVREKLFDKVNEKSKELKLAYLQYVVSTLDGGNYPKAIIQLRGVQDDSDSDLIRVKNAGIEKIKNAIFDGFKKEGMPVEKINDIKWF